MKKTSLLSCLLLVLTMSGATAQYSRQTDSLALVALYRATGGPSWIRSDNWLTGPLGSWYGVSTQAASGRVDSLRLCANHLRGELPDALVGLDSLHFLLMQDNYLYGHVPLLGKIPVYDSLCTTEINRTPYMPCFQCYPLSGNEYQFSDIAKDPAIEENTINNQGGVLSVYSNILDSRLFSKDTLFKLSEGDPVELKFDYTAYPAVYFVWSKVGSNGKSDLTDTTDSPEYHIASFDTSIHAGQWQCVINRKNPPKYKDYPDDWQFSGTFKLVATNSSAAPSIQFTKSDIDWIKETIKGKEYVRTISEPFPTWVGLRAASPSAYAKDLTIELVKRPEHFQLSVFGSNRLDGAQAILSLPESLFPTNTAMTGYPSYTLQIHPRQGRTAGTDTIVIRATDPAGRAVLDTFLLRSITTDLMYRPPVAEDGVFSLRQVPTGTWIRWHGLSDGIEQLRITADTMAYMGGCEIDYSVAGSLLDRILTARTDDSLFIPDAPASKRYNLIDVISAEAINRTGTVLAAAFTSAHRSSPPQPFPAGNIEVFVDTLQRQVVVANRGIDLCSIGTLRQTEDGIAVEPRALMADRVVLYPIRQGVAYRLWITDDLEMHSSDTASIFLPIPDRPAFTSALDWELSCSKQILISSLYPNADNFSLTSPGSRYCSAQISGDRLTLDVSVPWQGTDTLPLHFRSTNGTQTDTFALLRHTAPVSGRLFSADTVRISLASGWQPFAYGSYLAQRADSADIQFSVLRSDSVRFTSSFAEIRPALHSYLGTMFYEVTSFSGTDTVTLVAHHTDCRIDTLVFIASCTATGKEKPELYPYKDREPMEVLYFWREKILDYENRGFYASEPETFPTKLDMRQFVVPNPGNKEMTISLETDAKTDKGLIVSFDGTYLTIRPRPELFYGYLRENSYGDLYPEDFDLLFTYRNAAGEKTYFNPLFGVTEKPISISNEHIMVCGTDTAVVDAWKQMRDTYGAALDGTDCSDDLVSALLKGVVDSKGIAKIWIDKPILQPATDELRHVIWLASSFGTSALYSKDFDVTVLPVCDAAPVLSGIPVQYIGTASPQLDLWAHVQDNWPASGLFWDFAGGSKLSWQYDYATGILTAQPKNASWEGTDTITVTVTDPNGLKSSASVLYTTGLAEISLSACGSYTFGSKVLDKSGTYTEKFTAVSGADSTVILHLTVHPVYNEQAAQSVAYGQTYQFGTQKLTKTGSYSEKFQSVKGCDSTVSLAFTVLPDVPKVIQSTEVACGAYSWRGRNLSISGTYYDSLKAVSGADSTYIMHLTVDPVYAVKDTAKLAFGSTYTFGTQSLTSAGSYTEVFKTVQGCDSTVTLMLEIIPPTPFVRYDTLAMCSRYMFFGQEITASGDYADTVRYGTYPISITKLHFVRTTEDKISTSMSVAFGQTYQFGTQLLTASGSYTETFKTLNGCDSTVTLAFTVLAQEAPHITLTVTEFSLAENSANGTALATITAEGSAGSALVYSISGSAAFAIDPTTGAVTVKDASLLDYETAQTLTFTVRVSDGTAYDEAEITVMLTDVVETGIAVNGSDISIYPNSFADRLTVDAAGRTGTLNVFAPNGTKIYSAEFVDSADIDTSSWPSGQYCVSITSGDEAFSASIIKE